MEIKLQKITKIKYQTVIIKMFCNGRGKFCPYKTNSKFREKYQQLKDIIQQQQIIVFRIAINPVWS